MKKILFLWLLMTVIMALACEKSEPVLKQTFHENGELKEEWTEIEHKGEFVKHGIHSMYDQEGNKRREARWHMGQKEGLQRGWHYNGQLWYVIHYKDGERNGRVTHWYNDGSIENESYYKDGQLHGISKAWHRNGTLIERIQYDMGKKIGERKRWDREGELYRHEIYENNMVVERIK